MPGADLHDALANKLRELAELASQRMGGAWTTGLCVVGKDMRSGVQEAQRVISLNLANATETATKARETHLAEQLRTAARDYRGHDSEGYVVGTIIEVAEFVEEWVGTAPKQP